MGVWADLRYATRSLTRTPALALVLLLTIALGIGGNASVVGFVRGLVTRDLPVPGIETVVSLFARDAQGALGPVSYDGYLSLKAQRDAFAWLGAARESQGSVLLDDRSLIMSVAAVTPELADLFTLPLRDGIVVSHRVWQHELGARTDVRGALIQVDGIQHRVAGVAPDWLEGLYLGRAVDIWMPLADDARAGSVRSIDRTSRTFWAIGRLRPGMSADRVQAAGAAIAVLRYSGMTPDVAGGIVRIGTLLPAAAGAVFFIACANVATFLLSRASARSRETSVRVAIGASRAQLAQQLLADSLVISVLGGACGLLLAAWTMRIVPALFFEQDAEQLVFAPDLLGSVAAAAACASITVVCGLIPFVEMRHDDPAAVLRRESAGPSPAMRRLRAGLVVAQMTCCCLLVISTGLLLAAFRGALQTSAGQRLGPTILATLQAPPLSLARPDVGLAYFREAQRAALSLPDIVSTAWVGAMPGSRPVWQSVRIEPARLPLRDVMMDVAAFTPQSLAQVTVPPIAGRMFGRADTPEACRVAIVNEAAANALFNGDAVGRSIEDPTGQRVEIIGVVAMREANVRESASAGASGNANANANTSGSTARSRPTIYYYAQQTGTPLDRTGPAPFRVPARRPPSPPEPTPSLASPASPPEPASDAELARGVLDANVVSSNYFSAMGLSAIAGRIFSDTPAPRSCRVAVINQEAAERYFGGGDDAVGGAVIDSVGRRTEIVGVVHAAQLRTAQRRVEPAIYVPVAQSFLPTMTMMLGARDGSDAVLSAVRRRLDAVPSSASEVPGGAPGGVTVTTLETHLSRTALAPERIAMVLVGASAVMALVLGVLGLYGAMTEAVRQRRREFAVRLALGAQGWRVIRQVLAEGARLAAAGTVLGMLGSFLVARWLARITPTAGSLTVWVWLAAPLVLIAAAALASVLPARRALTVDPLTVMRDE